MGLTSLVMLVSILRSAITFRIPSFIAASLLRPLFGGVEVAASPAAEDDDGICCGNGKGVS